jgi:hypothetical protein
MEVSSRFRLACRSEVRKRGCTVQARNKGKGGEM